MLTDKAAHLARCLDRGLLDGRDSDIQLVDGWRGNSDQAGGTQHAVAGREVGLLLEDVTVFCCGGGILDLADTAALVGVADELGLLLAEVSSGLVGAHRDVVERECSEYPVGEDERGEEAGVDQRPRPFADPEDGVEGCVCSQAVP